MALPLNFKTVTVTSTTYPNPVELVNKGAGQVLVLNTSTTNVVYLGTDPHNMSASSFTVTTLAPQSSVVFDGSTDVYAVTASGTAVVNIYPGASSAQIGTVDTSLQSSTTNQTVPASGNLTILPVTPVALFNAYDAVITAYCATQTTVGAPLTCEALVTFYADAAGTQIINQEAYEWWIGDSLADAMPVTGSGPMRGPYMSILLANWGGQAITVSSVQIYGSVRTFPTSNWGQQLPLNIRSGLTVAGGFNGWFGYGNVLFSATSLALPAGTYWQPLPLHAGQHYIRFRASAAPSNGLVVADGHALTNGSILATQGAVGLIVYNTSAAGTEVEGSYFASRAPVYLALTAPAGGTTISCQINAL